MKNKFLTLFITIATCSIAQYNELDSLWKTYKIPKQSDTNRLKILYKISGIYSNNNPDTCIILAEQQLQLAQKINAKKHEVLAYNRLGMTYNYMGNHQKALEFYEKGVKISEELGDYPRIKKLYNNIGTVYESQSNFPKALEYYLKCIKISEQIGDKKIMPGNYLQIGDFYRRQADYPRALEAYFKALGLSKEIESKKDIGACYNNIGIVYEVQNNYSYALKYYLLAIKVAEDLNDKYSIGIAYMNIGNVFIKKKDYSKAMEYLLLSLRIRKELDDKLGEEDCYINIGNIYQHQSNYEKAIYYYREAIKLYKETKYLEGEADCHNRIAEMYNNLGDSKNAILYCDSAIGIGEATSDPEIKRNAYQNLANAYRAIGKYKEAFESYVKFKNYTDSIFNIDNNKKIGDMKTKLEVDKKEAELKAQAEIEKTRNYEEKKTQKIITGAVIGGLILVLIFLTFVFNRLRVTRKQKSIIEGQKLIVEEQKHLVEEKHKEITDSINYAERIQRSFLATNELLSENLRDFFVFFQPKDVVSGDFYWASLLKNGNFALVTADSTGHGVPGAIMSILNISSIEKACEKGICEPAEILNDTRKTIITRLKKDGSPEGGKDGMDASLVCYDFKNNKFTYAAANNPIWIVRENEIIELAPDKMPIGKHDKDQNSFLQHEIDLLKNDVIYTLTDGMPDQFGGPKGKKFMYKQMKELLIKIAPLPMEQQHQKLEESFNNWRDTLEQIDDVTVIGVRIHC